jgi:hypothetical protein
LRTEVARHACRCNGLQSLLQYLRIAAEAAQGDLEVVALECPALKLASMTRRCDHFEALAADADPRLAKRRPGRHRERLLGHCVAVLQSCEAHVARIDLRESRELSGNPQCVRAALAHLQQQMVAGAVGLPAEPLLHEKVLGRGAQLRATCRSAVRARQRRHLFEYGHGACIPVVCSISTIAWHARPSPRPM